MAAPGRRVRGRDSAAHGSSPAPLCWPSRCGSTSCPRGVEESPAVAGPVQGLGRVHALVRCAEEGGAPAQAGGGLGLGAQQAGQAGLGRGGEAGPGAQRGAVAALLAQQPFHQAGDAQVGLAAALVLQPDAHLLERADRVHAPVHAHGQRAALVGDAGQALGVRDGVVHALRAPGRWGDAPDVAAAPVPAAGTTRPGGSATGSLDQAVSWFRRLLSAQVGPAPLSDTKQPRPGLASTLIQGREGRWSAPTVNVW